MRDKDFAVVGDYEQSLSIRYIGNKFLGPDLCAFPKESISNLL